MVRKLHRNEKIPYDLLLLADETVEAINAYIFDSEIYLYTINNKVIAVYVLLQLCDDTLEIKNIAVDTAHQDQGIGTQLLNHACVKAKEKGFKRIVIGTADVAVKQLALYKKAGFKIYDTKKGFFVYNYPNPIYENGLQLKDMVMLEKEID